MKKFLSLMLSILIVLSSCVSTAFANTEEKTMIEKIKIKMEMRGAVFTVSRNLYNNEIFL